MDTRKKKPIAPPGDLPPIERKAKPAMVPPSETMMPQRSAVVADSEEPYGRITLRVPPGYKKTFAKLCFEADLDQVGIFFLAVVALELTGIDKAKAEFERRGGVFGKQGGARPVLPSPNFK